jgi:hypothetical protein
MQVGDVVVAVGNYRLACGSGIYSHAIVAQVEPPVLVSEEGDMLWSATLYPGCVMALCQAHPSIVAVAKDRLRNHQAAEAASDRHYVGDDL